MSNSFDIVLNQSKSTTPHHLLVLSKSGVTTLKSGKTLRSDKRKEFQLEANFHRLKNFLN